MGCREQQFDESQLCRAYWNMKRRYIRFDQSHGALCSRGYIPARIVPPNHTSSAQTTGPAPAVYTTCEVPVQPLSSSQPACQTGHVAAACSRALGYSLKGGKYTCG